ncbi:MAG: sigma 54-interacting transcriptional regulator [Clostridia bacterium]|nr:sigma 54-interacting transcriptional regulator [Clostridia bacterium]
MSHLFKIQDTVQNIAEAISAVIGADVTIIDKDLKRIGGTGLYYPLINQSAPGNSLVDELHKTEEPKFMHKEVDPTNCINCPKREGCFELASVGYPIFYRNDIVGSIWIIAFNEKQRKQIIDNAENYKVFLQRMSGLIESKIENNRVNEERTNEINMIREIVNNVNDGIIVIDNSGKITMANRKAFELLSVNESYFKDKTFSNAVSINEPLNFKQKNIEKRSIWTVDGKNYDIIYHSIPLTSGHFPLSTMIIFRKVDDILHLVEGLEESDFSSIIGKSKPMTEVKELVRKAAKTESCILLLGETGTGKELFARAIHNLSNRRDKPFVTINCASIPETLLESELFGYEKGTFTGALSTGKKGKFEQANGGTIFLDEIGDMPLNLQPKILRVLQEKTIEKIGGNKSIKVDVRILAATNADLAQKVLEGKFRDDLYYRINVIPINIPPLRERENDIKLLAEYFTEKFCSRLGMKPLKISKEVIEFFHSYNWPGNVRELMNVIEYSVSMCNGNEIKMEDLPAYIKLKSPVNFPNLQNLKEKLEKIEIQIIRETLSNTGNSTEGKKRAAERLGIGIATLYRKIEKYNL